MSYYSQKSTEDILREVVASEVMEFSNGAAVSSPKMAKFIIHRIVGSFIKLGVAALFGTIIFRLTLLFVIVAGVYEIVDWVKFLRKDMIVELICEEAKKAPDKRISTLIAENCVRGENGAPFTLRETKPAKKRVVLPIVITLCSVFTVLAAGAAVYLFVPFTLYAETSSGYAVTLCRTGLAANVSVEPYRNGEPVVGINSGAFKNNFFLKDIELPDTLTYIEGEAFMNCVALECITIPPHVTEIRGDTFSDCKRLQDVQLHDNITALHAGCFKGCESLREITLPHGITEIRANTFDSCYSLMRINIPEGVTRIAARAFYDCDSLYEVYVPQTVEEIGSSAFRNCEGLTRIVLPKGCSVNERAFKESPTEILYY